MSAFRQQSFIDTCLIKGDQQEIFNKIISVWGKFNWHSLLITNDYNDFIQLLSKKLHKIIGNLVSSLKLMFHYC